VENKLMFRDQANLYFKQWVDYSMSLEREREVSFDFD
jgi:hypothetical protein